MQDLQMWGPSVRIYFLVKEEEAEKWMWDHTSSSIFLFHSCISKGKEERGEKWIPNNSNTWTSPLYSRGRQEYPQCVTSLAGTAHSTGKIREGVCSGKILRVLGGGRVHRTGQGYLKNLAEMEQGKSHGNDWTYFGPCAAGVPLCCSACGPSIQSSGPWALFPSTHYHMICCGNNGNLFYWTSAWRKGLLETAHPASLILRDFPSSNGLPPWDWARGGIKMKPVSLHSQYLRGKEIKKKDMFDVPSL